MALAGCGATFEERARDAYGEGRFLDAAERLAQCETDVAELPCRRRVRYGLYRGLALLELGDRAGARKWLRYAAEPRNGASLLSNAELATLQRGLRAAESRE